MTAGVLNAGHEADTGFGGFCVVWVLLNGQRVAVGAQQNGLSPIFPGAQKAQHPAVFHHHMGNAGLGQGLVNIAHGVCFLPGQLGVPVQVPAVAQQRFLFLFAQRQKIHEWCLLSAPFFFIVSQFGKKERKKNPHRPKRRMRVPPKKLFYSFTSRRPPSITFTSSK